MHKKLGLALLILIVFLFTGCLHKQNSLYIYNWSYYTPEGLIEDFEKEFNCKVYIDYFSSNEEMYSKISASKGGGYDIVFPSADFTQILMKQNLLAKINKDNIPNLEYLTPLVKEKATYDSTFDYSVPYYMGATGIAVNKTKVSNYPHSWSVFSNTKYKNKMCMLDDMREIMGAALTYLGYSVNSTNEDELKQAYELIINDWKPNLTKFDAEGFAKSFSTGEYLIAHGYAESFFEEMPEARWGEIDFFIPEEGGPLYIDSMCILHNSKNKELAEQFINYILEPEHYAQFLDRFGFPSSTNTQADLYRTTEPHYTTQMLENCELKDDIGEDLTKYFALWEDIRYED